MQAEDFIKLYRNHSLLNMETAGELKEMTLKYPWFEAGWLIYLKNLKIIKSREFERELKTAAVHVANRSFLLRYLNTEQKNQEDPLTGGVITIDQPVAGANDGKDKEQLIDRFLEKGPGRIKVKPLGEGDGPREKENEIIKKSNTVDDDIITETLAGIYFEQKNYEKALEAYKKLSLKYPEKSVYFATRIKEIEEIKEL